MKGAGGARSDGGAHEGGPCAARAADSQNPMADLGLRRAVVRRDVLLFGIGIYVLFLGEAFIYCPYLLWPGFNYCFSEYRRFVFLIRERIRVSLNLDLYV